MLKKGFAVRQGCVKDGAELGHGQGMRTSTPGKWSLRRTQERRRKKEDREASGKPLMDLNNLEIDCSQQGGHRNGNVIIVIVHQS